MPAFTAVEACWICGGSRLTPIHDSRFELSIYRDQDPALSAYTASRVTMMRCDACGFGQPAALPALNLYFARLYDQRWSAEWLASEFASHAKTSIFTQILRELESRLPASRRRLLDVGAHVGKFLDVARARGWSAAGVELNPTTAAYARHRTGLPVHERPLESLVRDAARYDAVTLTDVLEHMPMPAQALRDAARVLAPGGWLAVKVPCGPNQLLKERIRYALHLAERVSVADNLVHVSHFSPKSLRMALNAAGFHDVTITVGRPERLESGAVPRRLLANAIRATMYGVARAIPNGVNSPLAFNLQAFARVADPAS